MVSHWKPSSPDQWITFDFRKRVPFFCTYLHFCLSVFYRTRSLWRFREFFSCFLKDSYSLLILVLIDGFVFFPFWFGCCAFWTGVSHTDSFPGAFSSVTSFSSSSPPLSSSSSSFTFFSGALFPFPEADDFVDSLRTLNPPSLLILHLPLQPLGAVH